MLGAIDREQSILSPRSQAIEAAPDTDVATPWLPSIRTRLDASAAVTFYASYLQGLEDSALAPSTAVNHGELPQATRSRQSDGGVRYAPSPTTAFILGGSGSACPRASPPAMIVTGCRRLPRSLPVCAMSRRSKVTHSPSGSTVSI